MARKTLIAGNWKMNTTLGSAEELMRNLLKEIPSVVNADLAVYPPFTVLYQLGELLKDTVVALGAQDLFWEEKGAYTGEISAAQIRDSGATLVLAGHSERRHVIGEDDETVHRKVMAALKGGLEPCLCVGEKQEQREGGQTSDIVESQLKSGLKDVGPSDISRVTIAYEPVWAIGTGLTATPEQAQDVHLFIRKLLKELYGEKADEIRILYGGSAKPGNAAELLSMPDVDGLLVGGASLDAESFAGIIKCA